MQTDPDDFEAKRLEMEAEAAIKAMEMRRLEEEEKRKKREEEEKQAEQKKQVDRARPVTSTQVPGMFFLIFSIHYCMFLKVLLGVWFGLEMVVYFFTILRRGLQFGSDRRIYCAVRMWISW